jgi:3-hydroxyisobutyrate dehydrogenase-like beta-hydroxyacid dehydrogenase
MDEVTVIGLGSMGSTIARLLIESGRRVTVWNRSPEKADALTKRGAILAPSVEAAVRASPVILMCVYDYKAANSILEAPGVAAALQSRILVQLTTGSPEDSRLALVQASRHGAGYLAGAIQAAPSQMGQADTPLLLSGDQDAYGRVEPILKTLAGNIVYLGGKIEAAATMDLATLSYVYGAFAGFLHGARIAESAGLDVSQFGKIVNAISPSFGAFFEHEGKVIASGDFTITESPLRISVEAVRRILLASQEAAINTAIPALLVDLLDRADAAGLGNQELASLIKVLRE